MMTLMVLYLVALTFEIMGATLLILDIRQDQRELRATLEESRRARSATEIRVPGGTIGGAFGALVAQSAGRHDVLEEFTYDRIKRGYAKRWWAVGILLAGIVVAATANVLSIILVS